MLEFLQSEQVYLNLFRFSNQQTIEETLREQGLEQEGVREMSEFLRLRGIRDDPEDLLDTPFRPKATLHRGVGHKTRFSDGSFPVFYSALEKSTAEAEIRHWFPQFVGSPNQPRIGHYVCFRCDFEGMTKDLRPMRTKWADLTSEDYEFCNGLGKEAISSRLDALLSPSARSPDGTTVPVFTRSSVENPRLLTFLTLTYDPSTGEVEIKVH